jgi:hypothetical protein
MRVLIACEFSGVVRDAFIAKGHDAMSCDLLPTERPGPHYQGDVFDILFDDWDMVVAFPPCTHLAVSGAKHFKQKIADGRQKEGINFFMAFTDLDCPRVAIENPIGIMSTKWRKPDQIINPYEFGHSVPKATCLWLKGLPPLMATKIVDKGEYMTFPSGKRMSKWYADKPFGGAERAKIRSTTFQGIADAMAEQWCGLATRKSE